MILNIELLHIPLQILYLIKLFKALHPIDALPSHAVAAFYKNFVRQFFCALQLFSSEKTDNVKNGEQTANASKDRNLVKSYSV